ncbi:hypothetical protein ROS1_48930 [Roseibium sp. ROS1]
MRSMARWVLPVLVGPSTAVTVRDRADGGSGRVWGRGMGRLVIGFLRIGANGWRLYLVSRV